MLDLKFIPKIMVFDFDGVFTDNTVITDSSGRESVICSKGDSLGIKMIMDAGIKVAILTSEKAVHPTLDRCEKMGLMLDDVIFDCWKKEKWIKKFQKIYGPLIFMGNDVNDVEGMKAAAFSCCPQDAHETAQDVADRVMYNIGGYGAVRELCDLVLKRMGK